MTLPEELRKAEESEFDELIIHLKKIKAKHVRIDLDSLELQAMLSHTLKWKEKRNAVLGVEEEKNKGVGEHEK